MFYRICWFLCYLPLKFFFRIKVIGKKNLIKNGKCVGMCNHYAFGDVLYLGINIYRQIFIVGKKELFEGNKVFSWLIKHLGAIPIDRNNSDLAGVKQCLKTLKDEKMLMIFPEGTRNREDSELKDIKGGAAMFAIKGKAPIVPMVLHDRVRVFKKAYLKIGEPFELDEFYGKRLDAESLNRASFQIQQRMEVMKAELAKYVEENDKGAKKRELRKMMKEQKTLAKQRKKEHNQKINLAIKKYNIKKKAEKLSQKESNKEIA